MSVLTPKRVVLFAAALLFASGAWASYPSPRTLARMAYDTQNKVGVMFGGRGAFDGATSLTHNTNETWFWTGLTWLQQFPEHQPPARGAHTMTYDPDNGRVFLFGGRVEADDRDGDPTYLNDLWYWKDGDWTRVETSNAPSPRHYSGLTWDRERERLVLFGGNGYGADGVTLEAKFDTWEFDGTNWTQISSGEPKVAKPVIAWDPLTEQIVMLGVNETGLTRVMYRYDAAAGTWTQMNPAALPTCINEGHLMLQEHSGRLLFMGGVCPTDTPGLEEVFEWNGTTWTKITISNSMARNVGQAVTWETLRQRVISFGGTSLFDSALSAGTAILENGRWSIGYSNTRPYPRSLAAFESDPVNGVVWLFGGLDDLSASYFGDLWGYRNGHWFASSATGGPTGGCETPLSAYDSDRSRLVVTCSGTQIYEFDGTTWKTFTDLKKSPDARNWARMVYDRKLKKTVLFGGYLNGSYRNDTWTWNGTEWTEVKVSGDKPDHRALFGMWYDPLAQKTILYGGFGRPHTDEKITRYEDMWAFDGSRWTELKPSQTPGPRFGPQIAVNPESGRVLLFGGLRSEKIDEDSLRQFFDNDTWQWDGAANTWTRLEPQRKPPARQNGMLAWDPVANEMVLYGGYAEGFYFTDLWIWDGQNWVPRVETFARRRSAGR